MTNYDYNGVTSISDYSTYGISGNIIHKKGFYFFFNSKFYFFIFILLENGYSIICAIYNTKYMINIVPKTNVRFHDTQDQILFEIFLHRTIKNEPVVIITLENAVNSITSRYFYSLLFILLLILFYLACHQMVNLPFQLIGNCSLAVQVYLHAVVIKYDIYIYQ